MTTLPHLISGLMPRFARNRLLPKWNLYNQYHDLRSQGGAARYDRELQSWVVHKRVGHLTFDIPVRSAREFRRVVRFGAKDYDIAFDWLNAIDDCKVLYDIGAANGHEGFFANALHGCKVVFVEIFTPSIETILKGVVLAQQRGAKATDFEILPAGADDTIRYSRMLMHELPNAGNTLNTFSDPAAYRTERAAATVAASQWLPSITVDALHFDYGIDQPTHVIIDIDGFEDRAIRGASRTLASGCVRSWMIEINPGRFDQINKTMREANYVEIGRMEHHPGLDDCIDVHYVRRDLEIAYRSKMEASKARRSGAWGETAPT